jgi:hypothetical protein
VQILQIGDRFDSGVEITDNKSVRAGFRRADGFSSNEPV